MVNFEPKMITSDKKIPNFETKIANFDTKINLENVFVTRDRLSEFSNVFVFISSDKTIVRK